LLITVLLKFRVLVVDYLLHSEFIEISEELHLVIMQK